MGRRCCAEPGGFSVITGLLGAPRGPFLGWGLHNDPRPRAVPRDTPSSPPPPEDASQASFWGRPHSLLQSRLAFPSRFAFGFEIIDPAALKPVESVMSWVCSLLRGDAGS